MTIEVSAFYPFVGTFIVILLGALAQQKARLYEETRRNNVEQSEIIVEQSEIIRQQAVEICKLERRLRARYEASRSQS